jgi:mRNA-degrading endonuclease RelE of RelBE toxin-antitoxin system
MPPLEIEFSPRFRTQARGLPDVRQQELAEAVARLRETFGQPHIHAGLGIRRLFGYVFEFRVGRELRVVFELTKGSASLLLVGTHDDVRRFIKNR